MSNRRIKQNPVYYLQHLREQVQQKKSKASTFNDENSVKEQNFKLLFNGANEGKALQKTKRINERSKSPSMKKLDYKRKRWGTPSTPNLLKESYFTQCLESETYDLDIKELVVRFKRLSKEMQDEFLQKIRDE